MESFRLNTFEANVTFPAATKNQLAQAGFFYSNSDDTVKCFSCHYQLATSSEINPNLDAVSLHRDKRPDCRFARSLSSGPSARSQKFLSYDSLRYEKERLDTFIEWPVPWMSPRDLAADGYYYIRKEDHCACVFCRGIVGAWERGDTPRREHQRHFPHCPFIRGQPVGNVPAALGVILDGLRLDGEECPMPPGRSGGESLGGERCLSGSYAECSKLPMAVLIKL